MKKTICGFICLGLFLLMVGIIGGVECGQPLSNAFWCFPISALMWVWAKIGRLFED